MKNGLCGTFIGYVIKISTRLLILADIYRDSVLIVVGRAVYAFASKAYTARPTARCPYPV